MEHCEITWHALWIVPLGLFLIVTCIGLLTAYGNWLISKVGGRS